MKNDGVLPFQERMKAFRIGQIPNKIENGGLPNSILRIYAGGRLLIPLSI